MEVPENCVEAYDENRVVVTIPVYELSKEKTQLVREAANNLKKAGISFEIVDYGHDDEAEISWIFDIKLSGIYARCHKCDFDTRALITKDAKADLKSIESGECEVSVDKESAKKVEANISRLKERAIRGC